MATTPAMALLVILGHPLKGGFGFGSLVLLQTLASTVGLLLDLCVLSDSRQRLQRLVWHTITVRSLGMLRFVLG